MTDNFSQSPNPRRLYKSREHKMIAGVCGGIAEYFDIDVVWVRIAAILLFFFGAGPFIVIAYIVAMFVMPKRVGPAKPLSEDEDQFWRGVSRRPQATFSNMKYRFRDMDARLADIERVVTSDEWKLRRQFKEIE